MSNGYAADEPRHVEMAAIDEDVRQMAITGSIAAIQWNAPLVGQNKYGTNFTWTSETPEDLKCGFNRALRVLRHYGLLVEHGDGVVSVKETP